MTELIISLQNLVKTYGFGSKKVEAVRGDGLFSLFETGSFTYDLCAD